MGFGKFGFVAQLFSVFKNSEKFCVQESKLSICKLCHNKVELPWIIHSVFFEISKNLIKVKSLPLIINFLISLEI